MTVMSPSLAMSPTTVVRTKGLKTSVNCRPSCTILRYLVTANSKPNSSGLSFTSNIVPPPHALYQGWATHDRDIAQLTRIIDKSDAIFSTLLAERAGHAGYLSYKERHYHNVTSSDEYYAKLCKTDLIADTWAAHFLQGYHDYYGFPEILSVLHAAVLEVRGVWYPWWNDACKTFGVHSTFPD